MFSNHKNALSNVWRRDRDSNPGTSQTEGRSPTNLILGEQNRKFSSPLISNTLTTRPANDAPRRVAGCQVVLR